MVTARTLTVPQGALQRIPSIVAALIALALLGEGWLSVRAAWVRRQGPAPSRIAVAEPAAPVLFDQLLNGHLFGTAPAAAGAGVAAPASLTLAGTIAFADPTHGFALISESGGPNLLYAVGAGVPGGAILREVFALKVILERNGVRETLEIPRAQVATVSSMSDKKRAIVTQNRVIAKTELPKTAIPLPVKRDPNHMPNVVARTPLLRALDVAPLIMEGSLIGYRIGALANSPLLAGVPPQTVITAINGVKLEDGTVAAQLFEQLSSDSHALLTVLAADGGSRQITVDGSGLAALGKPAPARR